MMKKLNFELILLISILLRGGLVFGENFNKSPNIKGIHTSKEITFPLRKYGHVKKLYHRLSNPVIALCVENNIPPGAVLSIISLESGWGSGYVGQITGNFLSLNAVGREAELPALYLPKVKKTGKILFDKEEQKKYKEEEIIWQQRPASLKKDYRPVGIAGTKENLAYFKNHPDELTQANLKNVKDFVTRFISYKTSIKAYRQARTYLDEQVKLKGKDILFTKEVNETFVKMIGGKPNSFNFRETWPKKVLWILNKVGAVELTKEMYLDKKSFKEAW